MPVCNNLNIRFQIDELYIPVKVFNCFPLREILYI